MDRCCRKNSYCTWGVTTRNINGVNRRSIFYLVVEEKFKSVVYIFESYLLTIYIDRRHDDSRRVK